MRDAYTHVYGVHDTVFSDQTGCFLTTFQQGNTYIMVLVANGSNTILVEPLTSHMDVELTQAYRLLML